eukprot:scaffold3370_cov359-Prasinococcus_capsulatus_cf.AAC.3
MGWLRGAAPPPPAIGQGLDYVVYAAGQAGVRLLVALANNWSDYGGREQYVRWSWSASHVDDFYTDDRTRAFYKRHVDAVLNRVNTCAPPHVARAAAAAAS